MHRIDTATKKVDLFGAGKHGFTDGDPELPEPPTDLNAKLFNALQEELCRLCEAMGITLDDENFAQVLQAFRNPLGVDVNTPAISATGGSAGHALKGTGGAGGVSAGGTGIVGV